MKPSPELDAAYAIETPEDNRALYRTWAATYDEEFIGPSGYVYHLNVAALLARELRSSGALDAAVLDVGCGTGIVGTAMTAAGITVFDGLDHSPEMLEQSRVKGVYRHLIEADLTKPVDLADASYRAIVSVGLFTHGHVGPDVLGELLRLTQPGGQLALGINAEHYEALNFESALAALPITAPVIEEVRIYQDADHEHADDVALTVLFKKA